MRPWFSKWHTILKADWTMTVLHKSEVAWDGWSSTYSQDSFTYPLFPVKHPRSYPHLWSQGSQRCAGDCCFTNVWESQEVAELTRRSFKCGWLISGDMKSLGHKQYLMFDLHLSVKWKCQDTWKNTFFESWVGWNTSHSVVICDPIPSPDTFKRKRQKTKNTWLIFGVKSNSLTLTHGYEHQGSVPCLTHL